MTFLTEWLFIIFASIAFGVAGGFVLIPLRHQFHYGLLAAPFIGMLIVTLGTLTLYVLLKLSFQVSFIFAATGCVGLTIFSGWVSAMRVEWRSLLFPATLLVLVALASTLAITTATLAYHSPSVMFWDGTDQVVYTHTPRWMIENRITQLVNLDQNDPYQTWIYPAFFADLRSISFAFPGIIALLRGLPPFFAFDSTCAVVMTAGVLSVAALFARRPLVLLFLTFGLFTSHWYDYSRTGYFGKVMCYPATFSLAALVMVTFKERISLPRVAILALMTCAAALTITGVIVAFYLALLGGGYVIWSILFDNNLRRPEQRPQLFERGLLIFLLMGLAIASSGILARPLEMRFPHYAQLGWPYTVGRMLDLDNQGVWISGMNMAGLMLASVVAIALVIGLAAISVRKRNSLAAALLIMPLLQFAGLLVTNSWGAALQMIGTFHPLWLCGIAVLLNDIKLPAAPRHMLHWLFSRQATTTALIIGLAFVDVGLRVPRFVGAVDRYAGNSTPASQKYVKRQFDGLAAAIGDKTVDVDVPDPIPALVVLTELVRRGLRLQWAPRTWKIVSYGRPVPPPTYKQPGTYLLQMTADKIDPPGSKVLYETNQLRLLEPKRQQQP